MLRFHWVALVNNVFKLRCNEHRDRQRRLNRDRFRGALGIRIVRFFRNAIKFNLGDLPRRRIVIEHVQRTLAGMKAGSA